MPAGKSGSYAKGVSDGVLDIVIPALAADPTESGITQYAAAVRFTELIRFLNQTLTIKVIVPWRYVIPVS